MKIIKWMFVYLLCKGSVLGPFRLFTSLAQERALKIAGEVLFFASSFFILLLKCCEPVEGLWLRFFSNNFYLRNSCLVQNDFSSLSFRFWVGISGQIKRVLLKDSTGERKLVFNSKITQKNLALQECHLPDMKTDQMHSTYFRKFQLTLTISLHVKLHYVTNCYFML